MSNILKKFSLILLGLFLLTSCNGNANNNEAKNQNKELGSGFTLQSASGKVSLSDFKGKVVMLYFGYTSCPDICPSSLAVMSVAIKALNKEERQQVQPILISLDPERDDVKKLKEYVAYFLPEMIGLTGTKDEINNIAKAYNVNYNCSKPPAPQV